MVCLGFVPVIIYVQIVFPLADNNALTSNDKICVEANSFYVAGWLAVFGKTLLDFICKFTHLIYVDKNEVAQSGKSLKLA